MGGRAVRRCVFTQAAKSSNAVHGDVGSSQVEPEEEGCWCVVSTCVSSFVRMPPKAISECQICKTQTRHCADHQHHVAFPACGQMLENAAVVIAQHNSDCSQGQKEQFAQGAVLGAEAVAHNQQGLMGEMLVSAIIGSADTPQVPTEICYLDDYKGVNKQILDERFGFNTFPMLKGFIRKRGSAR